MNKNEIRDKITDIFTERRTPRENYTLSLLLILQEYVYKSITDKEMIALCRYAEFRFNRQELLDLYEREGFE